MKLMKSIVVYENVTSAQWKKFHDSATRSQPSIEAQERMTDVVIRGMQGAPHKDSLSWGLTPALTEFLNEQGKKTYCPFNTNKSVSRDPLSVFNDSLKLLCTSDHGERFSWYGEWFAEQTCEYPLIQLNAREFLFPGVESFNAYEGGESIDTLGLVDVTQEPGGKARFYVSVHPAIQCLMSPLQDALKYRARHCQGSYAFDQDAGRRRVQKALKEGHRCHSFDLSDASNNYPLEPQLEWMKATVEDYKYFKQYGDKVVHGLPSFECGIQSECIGLFAEASRARYALSDTIRKVSKEDVIRFTVGQPLGLLPSAMSLHLTHLYHIRGLCRDLYGEVKDAFAVLIDDVVIWDDQLAKAYAESIESLGIPIQRSKTLVSDKAAEFLGRYITKKRVIEITKQQPIDLNNIIDYAAVFGVGVVDELRMSKSKKTMVKAILSLPRFLGGAGLEKHSKLSELILSTPSLIEWIALWLSSDKKAEVDLSPHLFTGRVRDMLVSLQSKSLRFEDSVNDILCHLLPKRNSHLPFTHQVLPGGVVVWNGAIAQETIIPLSNPLSGVLVRKDKLYDDIRAIHKPLTFRQRESQSKAVFVNSLSRFLNSKRKAR